MVLQLIEPGRLLLNGLIHGQADAVLDEQIDEHLLLDDVLLLGLRQVRLDRGLERWSRHLRGHMFLHVRWAEMPLLYHAAVPALEQVEDLEVRAEQIADCVVPALLDAQLLRVPALVEEIAVCGPASSVAACADWDALSLANLSELSPRERLGQVLELHHVDGDSLDSLPSLLSPLGHDAVSGCLVHSIRRAGVLRRREPGVHWLN